MVDAQQRKSWEQSVQPVMDIYNHAYHKRVCCLMVCTECISIADSKADADSCCLHLRACIWLANCLRRDVVGGSGLFCKDGKMMIRLDWQRQSWRFWWRGWFNLVVWKVVAPGWNYLTSSHVMIGKIACLRKWEWLRVASQLLINCLPWSQYSSYGFAEGVWPNVHNFCSAFTFEN